MSSSETLGSRAGDLHEGDLYELDLEDTKYNVLSNIARLCLVLSSDQSAQQITNESPSELSQRIMERTGLDHEETIKAMRDSINDTPDHSPYVKRVTDAEGEKRMVVSEAGMQYLSSELEKIDANNN
jgi:hypothetical protein